MSDRGTDNAPNTRNPERPASHPSRLDQFADDPQLENLENLNQEKQEEDRIVSFDYNS